ncbi:MAG: hypothetical protein H6671_14915 [Anaerolineaceae bacterium]|nr:hypothetical protein [Anaerolineaceae bacterium]
MTAQITDKVVYQGESYQIIGVKGGDLPKPEDFEMRPQMMSTACYRGFFTQYICEGSRIFLAELTVRTSEYKPVNGVVAQIGGTFSAGQYFDVDMPLTFSGGLLIAKDFISARYVHMGFQKPTSFQTVLELLIENGRIVDVLDHSRKVAQMRDEMEKMPAPGFDDPRMQSRHLQEWIQWTFSLDYNF